MMSDAYAHKNNELHFLIELTHALKEVKFIQFEQVIIATHRIAAELN